MKLHIYTARPIGLAVFFLWVSCCIAQKHDYNWLFGYQYSEAIPGIEITNLNFSESPVIPTHTPEVGLTFDSANAVASDSSGNLRFYTNGCEIFSHSHILMEGGEEINPGNIYDDYCLNSNYGYITGTQSMLVLPVPNYENQYFLIYKHLVYYDDFPFSLFKNDTRVALIDMDLNNGEGKVLWRDYLLADSTNSGMLTAVKHANGSNWWLVDSKVMTNNYLINLIDSNGIQPVKNQLIGNLPVPGGMGGGQAKFSPDGSMYARYSPDDDLMLFDFDRETGELSNFRFIPIEMDGEVVGGIEFSASGQFLYIASYRYLLQLDLWADDVPGSLALVGEYDGYVSPFPTTFYRIERGPDCRIYVFCGSCDVIHIIQQPDEKGMACQFEQHVMQLPYNMFRTAPHFPNYRLGPVGNEGEPCTPLLTSTAIYSNHETEEVMLFPQPAADIINLHLPVWETSATYKIVFYNSLGQIVLDEFIETQQSSVSVNELAAGFYGWQIRQNGQIFSFGKLIKK